MQLAPIPLDEEARQASLDSLHILDTAVEERFERVTRMAARLLEVPYSAVTLIDGNRQWFKSMHGLNLSEGPRDISFCGHAIMGKEIFMVEDATKDDRFHDNPMVIGDPNIRFYAGHPIKAPDGRTIGSLCVIDKTPRTLSSNQIEDLKDLAAMVEIEFKSSQLAAAQVRMNKELRAAKRAILIDPLTRLWNRAGGEEFLQRQHALAIENHEKFCIGMIDIDHFKQVNDTFGHSIGDAVLQEISHRILRSIRTRDFACRRGGEEFLLCISDPQATEAFAIAQKVRETIRSTPVTIGDAQIPVTISMGLSYFDPAESVDFNEVIKLADAGLYRAKQTGRDRIIFHMENSA